MQEIWIWSLGGEDALEKEVATHSNILAWKIPWMEEPEGLQSVGLKRVVQWLCDLVRLHAHICGPVTSHFCASVSRLDGDIDSTYFKGCYEDQINQAN